MDLTKKKCIPCEGGIPPLTEEKEAEFIKEIKGWDLLKEGVHRIRKEFIFNEFMEAISFVNSVAEIAEREGHHPNISVYYNRVVLELNTHAIKGLHLNDFILAAKIDEIR